MRVSLYVIIAICARAGLSMWHADTRGAHSQSATSTCSQHIEVTRNVVGVVGSNVRLWLDLTQDLGIPRVTEWFKVGLSRRNIAGVSASSVAIRSAYARKVEVNAESMSILDAVLEDAGDYVAFCQHEGSVTVKYLFRLEVIALEEPSISIIAAFVAPNACYLALECSTGNTHGVRWRHGDYALLRGDYSPTRKSRISVRLSGRPFFAVAVCEAGHGLDGQGAVVNMGRVCEHAYFVTVAFSTMASVLALVLLACVTAGAWRCCARHCAMCVMELCRYARSLARVFLPQARARQ